MRFKLSCSVPRLSKTRYPATRAHVTIGAWKQGSADAARARQARWFCFYASTNNRECTMKKLILAISFALAASPFALAQDKAEDGAKAAAPAAANTSVKQASETRKSQHERLQQRMIFCSKEADEKKLDGGRRKNYISSCVKK
jgi:hypothetical protein